MFFNPRRPVGFFSFALNYHWNGLDVRGYHLINLILHILNALLVWRLMRLIFYTPAMTRLPVGRYSPQISFFTAWLFVAHPVTTEAVTYIVQRLVLLSAFFYLLSLVLFLQGAMTGKKPARFIFFAGAALSAILAFFSKEPAYTLPLMWIVIWALFFMKTGEKKRGSGLTWTILAFPIVLAGILVFLALSSGTYFGEIPPREGHPFSITITQYYLTQIRVLGTYLRLILLPVNQTFDYDYPISDSLFESSVMIVLGLLVGILAASVILYKRYPLISFGIIWFFITILPQSVVPRPNVIFEHRVYLSSAGILLIWSILIFSLAGKMNILSIRDRKLSLGAFLLFLQVLLFAWFTMQRNMVWKTEFSLWTDCLRKAPGSARSLVNLGCALHERKEYREALIHFDQAVSIFPTYLQALNNRGVSKMALNDNKGAIDDFSRVIVLNGNFNEAWANRGLAHRRINDYLRSDDDLTEAIRLRPANAGYIFQRGLTRLRAEMPDSAWKDISQAARMGNPDASRFMSKHFHPEQAPPD